MNYKIYKYKCLKKYLVSLSRIVDTWNVEKRGGGGSLN